MKKQFVFLSGLPRTGSTLLSAILSQNPKIYSEGNSALCQLMFDNLQSCLHHCSEQLIANKRQDKTIFNLLTHMPYLYYKDVKEPIILDKCRAWTTHYNIDIIKNFIEKDFKMIILERNIIDIVKSFARLFAENNIEYDLSKLFQPNSEPLIRSISGLQNVQNLKTTHNNFLFIDYEDLVKDTENTIRKIYDFCGWEPYSHDYKNIVVKYPEDDTSYGIKGFHNIRPEVKKHPNAIMLSEDILKNCKVLNALLRYD
jgi:sulfotransferase